MKEKIKKAYDLWTDGKNKKTDRDLEAANQFGTLGYFIYGLVYMVKWGILTMGVMFYALYLIIKIRGKRFEWNIVDRSKK